MTPCRAHLSGDCRPISELLSRVGDKWSVLVIGMLGEGPLRFGELKGHIGGISQKMLTSTLRGLERDGFVTRTVWPTIPPKVEYALTDLGRDLLVPVTALTDWAAGNRDRVAAARAEFDARCEEVANGGVVMPSGLARPAAATPDVAAAGRRSGG